MNIYLDVIGQAIVHLLESDGYECDGEIYTYSDKCRKCHERDVIIAQCWEFDPYLVQVQVCIHCRDLLIRDWDIDAMLDVGLPDAD